MSPFAIRVDGVSKRYQIGGQRQPYTLLRDRIANVGKLLLLTGSSANGLPREGFWALSNVTFDVAAGEVMGVIGRNGAGKSTLLKILSRIAEPTAGSIDLFGRVGSLLEVGTGFHPELTGRENIYLNGAILGMRRFEIGRKLDEIVAFAEVEKFLDTPVKHFSSGMYLRLAFAVAAHLEPEILLVDEVLAVGDIAFQKKCLGKMNEVARSGRTVIFVSHNLAAIKELCSSCVVLDGGKLRFHGQVLDGLAHYAQLVVSSDAEQHGTTAACWSRIGLEHAGDNGRHTWVASCEPFTVCARLTVREQLQSARLYCLIDSASGEPVVHSSIDSSDLRSFPQSPGAYEVRAVLPPLWLFPNGYSLRFKLGAYDAHRRRVVAVSDQFMIDIRDTHGQTGGKIRAQLIPQLEWSVESDPQQVVHAAATD